MRSGVKMATRKEKMADRVVETAFYKVGNCRQIPLFDIPKIHKAGRESYDAAMQLPLTAAEIASIVEARLENEIAKVEVKR